MHASDFVMTIVFNSVGSGKKALDLFIAEINNLDGENYCSDYLLKHGLNSPEDESPGAMHQFAKIALLPLMLTTLDDVLGLFELHIVVAVAVGAAVGDVVCLSQQSRHEPPQ
jgi:hypothetical protein